MMYRITFLVAHERLATVLAATEKSDGVTLEGVVIVQDDPAAAPHQSKLRRKSRYANGQRDKALSAVELVHRELDGQRAKTTEELEAIFIREGFAQSTAATTLNAFRRKGHAVRDAFDKWHLT